MISPKPIKGKNLYAIFAPENARHRSRAIPPSNYLQDYRRAQRFFHEISDKSSLSRHEEKNFPYFFGLFPPRKRVRLAQSLATLIHRTTSQLNKKAYAQIFLFSQGITGRVLSSFDRSNKGTTVTRLKRHNGQAYQELNICLHLSFDPKSGERILSKEHMLQPQLQTTQKAWQRWKQLQIDHHAPPPTATIKLIKKEDAELLYQNILWQWERIRQAVSIMKS